MQTKISIWLQCCFFFFGDRVLALSGLELYVDEAGILPKDLPYSVCSLLLPLPIGIHSVSHHAWHPQYLFI